MEKIVVYLKQLNLSEIESNLYLTLLKTGPVSVRELAILVKIKRTTAYFYIDQLIEKGLVMKQIKGSRMQIASSGLENLAELANAGLERAEEMQKRLPAVLEEIHANFPGFKETDEFHIKHYKGLSGIRKIYQEALNSNELRSYVKLVESQNVFSDNASLFNDAFLRNPNLIVREILHESYYSLKETQQIMAKNNRYFCKFMPKDMNLTSEDILIYDGKVAIIHYRSKTDSDSVVLQNGDYYNNSKELFDFIWKIIPEITS